LQCFLINDLRILIEPELRCWARSNNSHIAVVDTPTHWVIQRIVYTSDQEDPISTVLRLIEAYLLNSIWAIRFSIGENTKTTVISRCGDDVRWNKLPPTS